jgi:putative transposase
MEMRHYRCGRKADVKRKLQNADSLSEYADPKRALESLHRELMHLNPSAARSLEEGLEETCHFGKAA